MKAISFLFWNICKNPSVASTLGFICRDINPDVIFIIEPPESYNDFRSLFNSKSGNVYNAPAINICEKVKLLSKFDFSSLSTVKEGSRYSAYKLEIPLLDPMLMVGIHSLPITNSTTRADADEELQSLYNVVAELESDHNITQTVVMGDFNSDPFDLGMIKAGSFNSTISTQIALRKMRTVQGKQHRIFYNPSWKLYSCGHPDIFGTYFYNSSSYHSRYWHVYDQVLIRPELISMFDYNSLKLISGLSNGASLLSTKKVPLKSKYSDHLPVTFTLNLP